MINHAIASVKYGLHMDIIEQSDGPEHQLNIAQRSNYRRHCSHITAFQCQPLVLTRLSAKQWTIAYVAGEG